MRPFSFDNPQSNLFKRRSSIECYNEDNNNNNNNETTSSKVTNYKRLIRVNLSSMDRMYMCIIILSIMLLVLDHVYIMFAENQSNIMSIDANDQGESALHFHYFLDYSKTTTTTGFNYDNEDDGNNMGNMHSSSWTQGGRIISSMKLPYLSKNNGTSDNKIGFKKAVLYASSALNDDVTEENENDSFDYREEHYEHDNQTEEDEPNNATDEVQVDHEYVTEDEEEEEEYESEVEEEEEEEEYESEEEEEYESEEEEEEYESEEEEEEYESVEENNHEDDYIKYEDDVLRQYFAFDDDNVRHEQCRRTAWHRNHQENCNMFHELDLMDADNPTYFLGNGSYRDAFKIQLKDEDIVLKLGRRKNNYE